MAAVYPGVHAVTVSRVTISSGGPACTATQALSVGDVTVFAAAVNDTASTLTVSDTLGQSFSRRALELSAKIQMSEYYVVSTATGSDMITATASSQSAVMNCAFLTITGSVYPWFDPAGTPTYNQGASTPSNATYRSSVDQSLFIYFVNGDNDWSDPAGWQSIGHRSVSASNGVFSMAAYYKTGGGYQGQLVYCNSNCTTWTVIGDIVVPPLAPPPSGYTCADQRAQNLPACSRTDAWALAYLAVFAGLMIGVIWWANRPRITKKGDVYFALDSMSTFFWSAVITGHGTRIQSGTPFLQ